MRKILEDLIFIGKAEEVVTLFGKEWKLSTLTSAAHLEATNFSGNYEVLSRVYALKLEILGRALVSVNDIEFENLAEKLELVKQLQPIVINKLYEAYEKMQIEKNKSLENIQEIKN